MIHFETFTLANGLQFIVHTDKSTPMFAMSILYDVGSRDESYDKTGFAHLFEHLMFGGSVHIPVYDEPVQFAGGINNAYTNNDITHYFLSLPASNAETAFWLESDRMSGLAFSEKSLEVQKQVVVEEFRQNYLNQPYGDAWLLLKPLAYTTHPYRWNTIGMQIEHIQQASLDEVKSFFSTYYHPSNAIVSISSNLDSDKVYQLAEKWFSPIAAKPKKVRSLPVEPVQTQARRLSVKRQVPAINIYKAYPMCGRDHPDYYATDLISDLLGTGQSSRLHKKLVKQQALFSDIGAFVTGNIDPGLLVITGKLLPETSIEQAEQAIETEIALVKEKGPSLHELRKLKNRIETNQAIENISVLDKALNLAFYSYLNKPELINTLAANYRKVSKDEIIQKANEVLRAEACNTLIYQPE
ncbi:MAG: pitrilysin family protein [Bacteroidales bacterium]|jgi:predicted Zn-dependent peptidase|nr:insulinase family protein [Bacteroidales bacterium]MDD3702490.1 pitrilysin family protein [Bacteroidales bacterium]MDY0368459.1 pitrilysin family protein [Bacteroidales bacterium]